MTMEPAAAAPRVVLGDDQSSGADLAWLWVNSQTWPGWQLDVVTAEPPPLGAPVPDEEAVPHEREGEPGRRVFSEPGFGSVRFLVARDDPRLALGSCTDAALVVVGPARTGLGPRLIGSTTEWLLQDPQVPLLLARRATAVRTVVVCADGSAHAGAAVAAFAAMPWASGTEVEVLTVDDGRTDTEAALADVVPVVEGVARTVRSSVRQGRSPHHEILDAVTATAPDLVVLGAHGSSMIRRLTLGSTASAVARLASASVLVAQDRA